MKEINQCPVCQSELKPHLSVHDLFGEQEQFEVLHCKNCNTLETNPQPDQSEIVKYYQSNSYVSHGDTKGSLFDKVYKTIQGINQSSKLRIIKKYSFGKTILDYGAGNGAFLNYMKSKAFNCTAVEPDAKARALIDSDIPNFANIEQVKQSFDIISCIHVLEHVHDITDLLNQFKAMLTRNGIIVLALPNHQSYDAHHYQEYWAGYDVPRHLHHFSQKSISTLTQKVGLNLVGICPLKFDSYYVSLLSEQYKKSNFAPIRGAYRGFISNRKAHKSGEYSSLIYVITN